MKIIFFGTSAFAARILTFLLEHKINIAAIVTRIDKPRGRSLHLLPPPVKETAQKIAPHIPLLQPIKASTPEVADQLRTYQPDLFVVVAYGEIIKQLILDIPRHGAINVHASLLPKYRGAAPMQRCLMHGESETGVTIMQMVLGMDAGDILEMATLPIPEEMTLGELDLKLSEIAGPALLKVIKDLSRIKPLEQNHSQATFAPKITAEEEKIDWNKSAEEIHNLIRALSPSPGAWSLVEIGGEKKRMKIKKSKVIKGEPNPKDWIVPCGQGSLCLLEVQLEGKKTLPAQDFLRGVQKPYFI